MDFDALRIVSNRWHLRRWKTVSEIVTFRCGSCFYVIFSFINTIRWWLWLVVACQGCLWTLCLLLWEHGVWWWGRGEYCLDFPGTVSLIVQFTTNSETIETRTELAPKSLEIARNCSKYLNWDFCQFFVVLHKIRHDCIMKLHGPFPQITKKTKHGNSYNDRSTLKNNNKKHDFWKFARSLYKFPCFVCLVVLWARWCNFVVR